MFCAKCGNNIVEGMKFCNSCGEKVEATSPAESPKVNVSQEPSYSSAPPPAPAPMPMPAQPPHQQAYRAPQQGAAILSVGDYIKMMLLMAIPIAGIVLLFMWAFGSSVNPNKSNFAKATLIFSAVFMVIWFVLGGILMGVLSQFMY